LWRHGALWRWLYCWSLPIILCLIHLSVVAAVFVGLGTVSHRVFLWWSNLEGCRESIPSQLGFVSLMSCSRIHILSVWEARAAALNRNLLTQNRHLPLIVILWDLGSVGCGRCLKLGIFVDTCWDLAWSPQWVVEVREIWIIVWIYSVLWNLLFMLIILAIVSLRSSLVGNGDLSLIGLSALRS
jgi:hypothetical protein